MPPHPCWPARAGRATWVSAASVTRTQARRVRRCSSRRCPPWLVPTTMPTLPDATVGIVVVSHSRVLADAAVALAMEMVHDGSVRVAVAAGLDETTFGTDAVAIKDAIEEVDGPAGVVVLMDL